MDQTEVPFTDNELRRAAGQIPLLVRLSGVDGNSYFFNSAWLAFTGRRIEQELGKGYLEAIHPGDPLRDPDTDAGLSNQRQEFEQAYRLKRYDGVHRWIAEKSVPLLLADGTFNGYAHFGLDIHDLVENNLEQSKLVLAGLRQSQIYNEELAAANEELSAANEELAATNEELTQTQDNLAELNRELENIVGIRTRALRDSEQAAQSLNEELSAVNEELGAMNEELSASNEELLAANEELAKSREEILKREQLFKSIALNIPKSLIIVIGMDHRFLAVEGSLMTKMGYDGDNYGGRHATEISIPESYKTTKPLYDRVLAGEQFTVDRSGKNGEYYRTEFVPLRNDSNEVYAALAITLDITDIRQAEEKSAKLAAIITSSDDAIVSKNLDGIVTSWNAAAERIFGYTEKEMIGQPILKIIPEDRHNEEPRILERLRRGERIDHFETKRVTKDGRELDISLTISPLKDSGGNIIGASKIARDISEKKRDEQRKNDFIGMVSHELKTPLTSLSAVLQLMQAKLGDLKEDSFINGAVKNANRQVKKMTAMINGFLNISRLESGKISLVKKDFVLNELVGEAIAETRLTGADHIFLVRNGRQIIVYADRDKIGSVILNLLSNAVKYSPRSSTIEVRLEVINDKVQVSVKDQGIGIKPNDVKKLFDRYYRVESAATQHISGFGIGLYLSAEIIHQHQGDIWVESKPGKGSTFYFTIPLKR